MKKNIISFLFGAIIFSSITVFAAYAFNANNVAFFPTDENWDVDNTQDAIDNLYDILGRKLTTNARKYLLTNEDILSLDDLFSSINFCSDSNRLNNVITNPLYVPIILSNSKAITALDNCSPKVSTTTSNAFASSAYSGFPASNAFDNDTSSYWGVAANLSYKNQYVGYDFGEEVWLYKMVINMSNGKQNTDYVLEGSNEKTQNYTIIKDGLHQGGGTLTIIPDAYTEKYRYYRVRLLSSVAQSGSGNTIVSYLRFYAK